MKSVMYHYVQNFDNKFKYLNFLSINNFKKQISFFKKNYVFFDVKKIFEKKKFLKKEIFLTFDDGLKCHFNIAKNILKPNKINAIFFVPVLDYKKKIILDVHRIHIILAKFGPEILLKKLEKLEYDSYLSKKFKKKFDKMFYKKQANINSYVKVKKILNFFIDENKKKKIVAELFYSLISRKNEKKIFEKFYLSKNDIQKMNNMNMLIGGHSESHSLMTKLSSQKAEEEIKKSKKFLKTISSKNFVFCYPYGGKSSYNKSIINILKKYKFDFSVSVESRDITNDDISKNKYTLPRYNCNKFPHGKAFKNKFN